MNPRGEVVGGVVNPRSEVVGGVVKLGAGIVTVVDPNALLQDGSSGLPAPKVPSRVVRPPLGMGMAATASVYLP